ncbi:hypothetical protein PAAG_05281 [Paracoccidioides lutzii Pb01]|uniref:Uncharacterized protein n=1 Tax=Paracoccidioides lutzii (strain ATCC MYA-826 / Pb01) TaxID=502779 RepID=C1H3D8_PARBA|nr:hypothetical protein PAAG_05281 [Paracoccidioides lutzii Pb01]EEH34232.2 hypothetical protein PAAG_05281 [Paracoccidioides lutzii Pb01]
MFYLHNTIEPANFHESATGECEGEAVAKINMKKELAGRIRRLVIFISQFLDINSLKHPVASKYIYKLRTIKYPRGTDAAAVFAIEGRYTILENVTASFRRLEYLAVSTPKRVKKSQLSTEHFI